MQIARSWGISSADMDEKTPLELRAEEYARTWPRLATNEEDDKRMRKILSVAYMMGWTMCQKRMIHSTEE